MVNPKTVAGDGWPLQWTVCISKTFYLFSLHLHLRWEYYLADHGVKRNWKISNPGLLFDILKFWVAFKIKELYACAIPNTNLLDSCDRRCWSHIWMTKESSCGWLCFLDFFPIVICFNKYSTRCWDRCCFFVHCFGIWFVSLKLFTWWDWWRRFAI